MICESGFQQGKVVVDSSGRYDKDGSVTGNSLITATRTAVKQYPQCVAYGIWNNGRGNLADFVDTSAASLAQYRAFAHDPGSPHALVSARPVKPYIWPGGVGPHAPGRIRLARFERAAACVAWALGPLMVGDRPP